MSNSKTIGANYYLAEFLSQYLHGIKLDEDQINYTDEQNKLEKEFMEHFLPFISKQGLETKKYYEGYEWSKWNFENSSEYIKYIQNWWLRDNTDYPEFIGKLTFDQSLKSIVDKLADISFHKIANKQQISEKDYGFILTKIALFIGDFVNIQEYNMLYLGLYHELSQGKDYGTYAEVYLKEMVLKKGLVDSRFYPKDENKSIKR